MKLVASQKCLNLVLHVPQQKLAARSKEVVHIASWKNKENNGWGALHIHLAKVPANSKPYVHQS
jgi:hypothetical protein